MNEKQKNVLLWMAVAIGCMVIFPPYVILNFNKVIIRSGYGLIFNLPKYVSTTSETVLPATVNVATLIIQIIAALIIGGLLCIAFKDK